MCHHSSPRPLIPSSTHPLVHSLTRPLVHSLTRPLVHSLTPQSINKSLSALADVVGALTGNAAHVPYRNHPLTMLMADCIGGSAKTCMLLCCSPHTESAHETVNSLNFAKRCKGITNTNIGRNMAMNAGGGGGGGSGGGGGGGGGSRLERKASDVSLKSHKSTKISPGVVSRAQQVLQDSNAHSNAHSNSTNKKATAAEAEGGGGLTRKPSDADIAKVQKWCEDELQRLKEVKENTAGE